MEEPKVEKSTLSDLIIDGLIWSAIGAILMRVGMIAWAFFR